MALLNFVMVSRVHFCSSFEFDLYLFNCNFIFYVNLVYDNKDFVVVVKSYDWRCPLIRPVATVVFGVVLLPRRHAQTVQARELEHGARPITLIAHVPAIVVAIVDVRSRNASLIGAAILGGQTLTEGLVAAILAVLAAVTTLRLPHALAGVALVLHSRAQASFIAAITAVHAAITSHQLRNAVLVVAHEVVLGIGARQGMGFLVAPIPTVVVAIVAVSHGDAATVAAAILS